MSFANSVYLKSAALDNVWGLVDGTLRDIARPVQKDQMERDWLYMVTLHIHWDGIYKTHSEVLR